MGSRKGKPYDDGELEVVLSLVPTIPNLRYLSELLGRSEASLKIIYRIAYQQGPFADAAQAQQKKVMAAKKRVGIAIGRQTVSHVKG